MNNEQKSKSTQPDADIVIDESGKIEEPPKEVSKPSAHKNSRWKRFVNWYKNHKKKSIPLTIVILLAVLAGVPWSRYQIAGLVLKNDLSMRVVDSVAATPVSGADVYVGSVHGLTDGSGKVVLHKVKDGPRKVSVTKKYYKDSQTKVLVPILKQKNIPTVKFVATGRQVKISVKNLIGRASLANVDIKIADISAKTDKSGNAIVVLPVGTKSQKATLHLDGYNDAAATVNVSDQTIQQNDFSLTPTGKVYFLSKLSGKIDVVKTNLDGTDRQTVLPGTGQEDNNNTVLLASHDWKYLALLSRRAGNFASIYLINTVDDKLITVDDGSATFTPVGWSNHYFVYSVAHNDYNSWQPNALVIKSYNAEKGQGLTLVNSQAEGTSNADAVYQNIFSTLIMGNDVVYAKSWLQYQGYSRVSGKQNSLAAIHADGSDGRQLKAVDSNTSYFTNLKLNKPRELDFGIYDDSSQSSSYFVLDKNGNITQSSSVTEQSLQTPATTFLLSPSGDQTFWAEQRDGKNTLLIGDQDAGNSKQIATLSDYDSYGWYLDDYLLVSKNNSVLYVMPKNGPDSQAVKITDYHKPTNNFYGYGG